MTDRGFYFASVNEGKKNVYTRHNADGTTIKQVILPGCKLNACVRQTNSRDQNEASQLAKEGLRHAIAILSTCTMLQNKRALLSEIEALNRGDLTLLLYAYFILNTEDWQVLADRIKSEYMDDLILALRE